MKKTILKAALISMVLATPIAVMAGTTGGLVGNCVDCHTMHGSEGGVESTLAENLLRLDCIECHANDPASGTAMWTGLNAASEIPQVAHGGTMANSLAGGNFSFGDTNAGDTDLFGNVHNVVDLFGTGAVLDAGAWEDNTATGSPPGNSFAGTDHDVFSVTNNFDAFTCAGARGCHGTRAQGMETDNDATTSGFQGQLRTGLLAINGSHHVNHDGEKNGAQAAIGAHSGAAVAAGYRFIPGLKGYGNEGAGLTVRWRNIDGSSHNEYYGNPSSINTGACGTCHVGTGVPTDMIDTTSTLVVPNQSMSGFCATCHGNFHSAGSENGSSGAFLRHPSDLALPGGTTEYAGYTSYSVTAPVARNAVPTADSGTVTPGGTDMVMCLSCHVAHGSDQDYLLRFDYSLMVAGSVTSGADTGCLACHTTKQ